MTTPNAGPPATVLVVDDNEANRALARDTLEDEGYRVVLASSGAEGLAAFDAARPDCVLLDVRMPIMDGFAVCEQIRARPRGDETPIIFLTALRDVDTFDNALRAGGDDFLGKPVRPTELVVRVQSALKLRRMRAELREYYEILKRQRDDLQRMQLQKERLIAFVVHDLKNPVNAMDLQAQALQRDRTLPESAQRGAAGVRASARQLGRMIQNLLDLSKADEGKLVPQRARVALKPLVDAVFADLDLAATARDVTLEADLAVESLNADPDLLRRILGNLVENAIRHAPSKSAIRVVAARSGPDVELRVADAGRGVPADMRTKIFDPFVQVEGTGATTRTGRGLGLAFCKMAVEAHGGTIGLEDAHPGAVFVLRLPDGE